MSLPTFCVEHQREITPVSWSAFEHAVSMRRFEACACGITYDEQIVFTRARLERERMELEELLTTKKTKADVGTTEASDRWFFITITQPPGNSLDRIVKVTNKFIKSKQIEMKEWGYCLELQENGTPHSHIRCRSPRKYLDKGKLKKLNDFYRIDVQPEDHGTDAYVSATGVHVGKAHACDDWFVCSENYTGTRPECARII